MTSPTAAEALPGATASSAIIMATAIRAVNALCLVDVWAPGWAHVLADEIMICSRLPTVG
jgi:hypothetical protein